MFWIFGKKKKKKVERPIKTETPIQPKPALSPKATPMVPPVEKVAKKSEPTTTNKEKNEPKGSVSDENPPYHVSHNKEKGKWRVRHEKSSKVIKYFDTQKEAIAYAEELAKSNGTSVIIHKLDGKIRRQNY